MQPIQPIYTAHLFSGLHSQLLDLLRGLNAADWRRATVCKDWTVHDIAAHILDTQIRLVTMGRDPLAAPMVLGPPPSYTELVGMLNQMNRSWVEAARRIGPRLLIEFLEITGPLLSDYVTSLDPYAPAIFPVAWAGEDVSENWFDIGRSYTEYWHHQQQIRDAVDAPPLATREWMHPVIALFVRALPHAYRETLGHDGDAVNVTITGEAGGEWSLFFAQHRWSLFEGPALTPKASVTLPDSAAWRLFTKALSQEQARLQSGVEGDHRLSEVFFHTVSVMA